MTGINALIRYVHANGWGRAIYDGAFPVIVIALLCYFLTYRKKYQIPFIKAVVIGLMIIPSTSLLISVLAWVENGFRNADGGNVLRVFVYVPLVCILVAKLLKLSVGTVLDFVAPAMVLWNMIGQSVCPFLGCCAGIPCGWGIWNPLLDAMVFPIQWLISLAAVGLFVFLLAYAKKHHYDGTGKVYAMFLIMWGGTRILLEYLKDDERLFLGLSRLTLIAVFMLLVGMIWLFTVQEIELENKRKNGKKIRKS